ncbi:interferon tau-1-like [Mus pahari]|uniref:interferon tau-1-like n=1 Tax=Mus pahari TaxID=10093 RepID=UPI000A310696|nr:interferon tau-1-like [Mus pahari]
MLPVHLLLFLVGGVMLSCSPASPFESGQSGSLHLERSETARFLAELQSVPGHQCLRDRTDFPCPWKEGIHTTQMTLEETTSCYSQTLRQVLHLFDTEASRAAWPERALEQLLTSLWSELQVLERPREQDQSCPWPFALVIRTYFLGFFSYLKAKAHSACSWEIVRVQLQVDLAAFPR